MQNEIDINVLTECKETSITVESEFVESMVSVEIENVVITVSDAERYKGDYVVTPLAGQSQQLETKNKILLDNVVVLEVPYYEVGNDSGTTVYIAKRGDE